MRIAVYPADEGACGMLRIQWPAEHLAAQGVDVQVNPTMYAEYTERFDGTQPPSWVDVLDVTIDADIAVFQRPLHRQYIQVIPILRSKGVHVVVELDDNFDVIDPANKAWHAAEPGWLHTAERAELAERHGPFRTTHVGPDGWAFSPDHEGRSHRNNLRTAITLADTLVVSTPALAAHYGPHAARTVVVPNRIPRRYCTFGRLHVENRPLTAGWTGSTDSHPRDLQVMNGVLARYAGRSRFHVVGTAAGVEAATGRRPNSGTGWVPLVEYPRAYAALDVAVCPLRPGLFNDAKSSLKMLEAAAVGAIPVCSPAPEYVGLHGEGVGLIAGRPKEWVEHLDRLHADPRWRAELRARGLVVAEEHTIEEHAGEWLHAWTLGT